jgi:hypothetical protein
MASAPACCECTWCDVLDGAEFRRGRCREKSHARGETAPGREANPEREQDISFPDGGRAIAVDWEDEDDGGDGDEAEWPIDQEHGEPEPRPE